MTEAIDILAVDDNPANLLVLDAMLEDMNVRLVTASSGEDALRHVMNREFALILLDVRMPRLDGLETAALLRSRERSRRIPIIFISAFERVDEQVEHAYSLGAVDFLFKPIVPEMLRSKVAVFIDLHRKTKAIQVHERKLREAQRREHERELLEQRSRWEQERLRSEVELQRRVAAERERQSVALQSIGDAVVAVDSSLRVSLMNRAAERLCAWSQTEAMTMSVHDVVRLLHPHSREPLQMPGSGEDAILCARDGTERLVAASVAPLVSDSSEDQGYVLVFRDITTQRQMEHDLRNNQRLESLGALAGGIAHDFNNMLQMILSGTSLAIENLQEESPAYAPLQDVEGACERATRLTGQLLTFARGGEPIRQLCNPLQLIKDSVEFSLRGSSLVCEFDLANTLWPAEVDAGQITQVLSNLVLNARYAMKDSGRLTVRAGNWRAGESNDLGLAPGAYVEIAVRDTGTGIAPEHLDRIFDPYFTTKPTGSGLGLATSYSIVHRHGGRLRAENPRDGGALFVFHLPALPNATVPEEQPPKSTPQVTRANVLVMDDEDRLRRLVADCLVALGCRVTCVADGRQAIECYRRARDRDDPFDVVILDLTVRGGMGGAETIRELRELDPDVVAIACSGYAADPVMSEYERHGFSGVLPKPFRFAELAKAVREAAGLRRALSIASRYRENGS